MNKLSNKAYGAIILLAPWIVSFISGILPTSEAITFTICGGIGSLISFILSIYAYKKTNMNKILKWIFIIYSVLWIIFIIMGV